MRIAKWTLVVALGWGAPVQPATAAVVTGSFAGVATDSLLFGAGAAEPTFEGAPVQGRFRVDTSLLGPQTLEGAEFASYRLRGDALLLTFTVLGTIYRFGDQGLDSVATIATGQGGQTVLFGANFLDTSHPTALLSFGDAIPAGAPGLFADGLDLTTFHPAPLSLQFAHAAFQLSPTVGARVLLSGLAFDGVTAVPEPAPWALLLAGLGLTAWRLRRRRRWHPA